MANFKTYLFTVFAILASLAACPTAGAQPRERREFAIHYRFDKIDVDSAYLDNAATIDTIRFYLTNSAHIDSITVYAWASPEGGYPHNKWLSEKRAAAAKELLLELAPDSTKLNEGKIKISPLAENWPGLTELVEKNYHRQDRDRLLRILRTEGIGEETRKWRIKQLDNGYTWEYLKRNYMKQLRSATWLCVWTGVGAIEPLQEFRDSLRSPQPNFGRTVEAVERSVSEFTLAAKTNLLGDLVTAVNFGLELPLGKNLSANAHFMFPWWTAGPYGNKYALQMLNAEGELRWWFAPGEQVLQGHYLALQGNGGKFDIQWGRDFGCYQCYNWGVGL
ncbi:MAG: DUF3575 domain-containing protein, partial [Bacteroides sp.]|nr:DUF3575 domain-containing protein [Bacteroides sp.]